MIGVVAKLSIQEAKIDEAIDLIKELMAGVAKEEVLAGTSQFIELTGNVKVAAATMELFAKVAMATSPIARPSMPSVRLTAFEDPTITRIEKGI